MVFHASEKLKLLIAVNYAVLDISEYLCYNLVVISAGG